MACQLFSVRAGVFSKKIGNKRLVPFPLGYSEYGFLQVIFIDFYLNSIQKHEDEGCDRSGALVAVYKGMIFGDVEQVGGSHRDQVFVEVAPTESGRRRCDGAL